MEIDNTTIIETTPPETEAESNEETIQEISGMEETTPETGTETDTVQTSPSDTETLPDEETDNPVNEPSDNAPVLDDVLESGEPLEEIDTVSGSDVRTVEEVPGLEYPSISGNDIYYMTEVSIPEDVPFWEKPVKDYNAVEGLLFLSCFFCFFLVGLFILKMK